MVAFFRIALVSYFLNEAKLPKIAEAKMKKINSLQLGKLTFP
jgi:hypothetical protein